MHLMVSDHLYSQQKEYHVAACYFPSCHPDSINALWHRKGWTEWRCDGGKTAIRWPSAAKCPDIGIFQRDEPEMGEGERYRGG